MIHDFLSLIRVMIIMELYGVSLIFSDLERTKKTKAILSSLGNQEGDVRKLQRKKSRMK